METDAAAKLVSNWSVEQSVEAFYTGGPVQITSDGTLLFTARNNVVVTTNLISDNADSRETIGDEETDSKITSMRVSRDDSNLVVAYSNLLLRHYRIPKERRRSKVEAVLTEQIPQTAVDNSLRTELLRTWKCQHRAPVMQMEFDTSSPTVLATGGADCAVKIWDLDRLYCSHNLKGASSVITRLLFVDGHMVFAGETEGKIGVWDLSRKQLPVVTLSGHTAHVTSLILRRDPSPSKTIRTQLISSSRDMTVVIWNCSDWSRMKTLAVLESVSSFLSPINADESFCKALQLSSDICNSQSSLFLSGGETGKLKLWDIDRGKIIWEKLVAGPRKAHLDVQLSPSTHIESILTCADSNLKRSYVIVTAEQNILMMDAVKMQITKQLIGYNDEILDAVWCSPSTSVADNETYLAFGTISADARLYNVKTMDCQLLTGHSQSVLAVDSPRWKPNLLATVSKDNSLRLWRLTKKKDGVSTTCIAVGTGHTNSVSSVRFGRTKTGHFVLTVSYDRTLKLWPLQKELLDDNHKSEIISLKAACTMLAHEGDITAVDVSPNDRLVATASLDKTARIWNIVKNSGTAEDYTLTEAGTISGHRRGIWDVAFSPSDQVVATASGDWTVKIFALANFGCLKTFESHQCAVLKVRFLPSGLQMLSADGGGLLKLWNVRTNECQKTYDKHDDKIWTLLVNRDGSRLVTGGSDSVLTLWRDVTETERVEAEQKTALSVEQTQSLANLISQRRFADALRLALAVNRPHNAFLIVQEMLTSGEEAETLHDVVSQLSAEQTALLLEFAAEWNTNGKNSTIAQRVLHTVLSTRHPKELLRLPNIQKTVESFLPYTERHFDRLTRLRQQAQFLDYTWQKMRLASD